MSNDYQPVACSFYDELGLRMMRGRPCTLIIDEAGDLQTIEAVIQDVYSEGNAEYVRLDDGRSIRLDRIQRVDDVVRPDTCGPV